MVKLKDVVGDSGLEENLHMVLKELLEKVKATLEDAEKRPIQEKSLLLWLPDLRNLALEMEDLDDRFQYRLLAMEAEESSMEVMIINKQLKFDPSRVVPVERAAASSSSGQRKQRYSHSEDEDEVRLSHASSSPPVLDHASFLKEMEDRLNHIQKRFKKITKQKKALRLPKISGQPSQYVDADANSMDRLTGSSMVNPEKFIGRDEQKKEILDMLIPSGYANPNPEVIALVGMGGIGKTTLCQHIYTDSEVRKHFDLMGWIHVGESLDVLLVTNNILGSFITKDVNYEQLDVVQWKLMEELKEKRFLLIMDDVCCEIERNWGTVVAPLLNNKHVQGGCKILVTTRRHEVAQAAGVSNPIQLNRLSPEDGWCLFRNYVVNRILDGHDELVDIGKAIVGKCDGLPLAIKVMGSLMRNKGDDVDSWRDIRDSDFSNIEEGRREILGPLYLSYLHLPPRLKACFKFFSLIPDRGNVPLELFTRKLTDLWLAHDLVGSNEGNCSFLEQGIKLIGEFESRSFIQRLPEEILDPRVGNCVHDLIFDLSQFVLDPSEIDKTDHCKLNKSSTPPTDARNLTIFRHSRNNNPFSIKFKPHVLPTLELEKSNCSPSSVFYPKLRYLHVGFANIQQFQFKHLRVLCMENSNMEEIPDSLYKLFNLRKLELIRCHGIWTVSDLIGNLKNLRSLSFRDCFCLEMIPESVSKLTALEELKIHGSGLIKALPDGITRLANLRCLDVKRTEIHCLPVGLSNLRKLRCLPCYPFPPGEFRDGLNYLNRLNLKGDTLTIKLDVSSLQVQEYKKDQMGIQIRELRNLRIRFHPSIGEDRDASKEEEEMLEHLKPNSDIRKILIHGYNGCYRLPLWMGDRSFHQLVSIQLEEFTWCKTLSPLQQLPSLEMLSIRRFRCLEKLVSDEDWGLIRIGNIPCSEQKLCFPKLHHLSVEDCGSMRFLHVYQFAALQTLRLYECWNLESIEFVDNSSSTEEHQDRGNPSLLITQIRLYDCPELCFSSNNNVMPPQSLEKIEYRSGCWKLVDWCRCNPNSKWTNIISEWRCTCRSKYDY